MSIAVVVLIGAVALVLTARSARRAWSDRRSLEEHHKALGTLGELAHQHEPPNPASSDQSPRFHVRVVSPEEAQPSPHLPLEPPRLKPWAVPEPSIPHPTEEGDHAPPAVSPAGVPAEPPAPPPAVQPVPPSPAPPPAMEPVPPSPAPPPAVQPVPPSPAMPPVPVLSFGDTDGHPAVPGGIAPPLVPAGGPVPPPPKPPPAPPGVAAVLVAGTVAGPTAGRRRRHTRPRQGGHRPVVMAIGAAAAAIVVVAVALTLLGGRSPRRAAVSPPNPAPAPTTTVPPAVATPAPPPAAVLVASDHQGATFSLAAPVQIQLVPTSDCWIQVRQGSASGPVVYEGILRPGQPYPLPPTGPVWIRLGNPPGVSVVVNGTPLQTPAPTSAQPYNLVFQPASTASASG